MALTPLFSDLVRMYILFLRKDIYTRADCTAIAQVLEDWAELVLKVTPLGQSAAL